MYKCKGIRPCVSVQPLVEIKYLRAYIVPDIPSYILQSTVQLDIVGKSSFMTATDWRLFSGSTA